MLGTNDAIGVFFLINLDCIGCARLVTKLLKKMNGVKEVRINYITDKVYVRYDPEKVTPAQIRKAIKNAGYKALEAAQRRRMWSRRSASHHHRRVSRRFFDCKTCLSSYKEK